MEEALQQEKRQSNLWTHEQSKSKKVVVKEEEQQVISQLSEDSILAIIEELAIENPDVEDLFREIIQRVEQELILDQFRNL